MNEEQSPQTTDFLFKSFRLTAIHIKRDKVKLESFSLYKLTSLQDSAEKQTWKESTISYIHKIWETFISDAKTTEKLL